MSSSGTHNFTATDIVSRLSPVSLLNYKKWISPLFKFTEFPLFNDVNTTRNLVTYIFYIEKMPVLLHLLLKIP